ncbi:MAG: diaminopimelate dehydrogenase [Oscillospiraceae bacterium]|nr:diaminopimelate dehydrogenase [Oscillospiraceae bacterium]
MKKIAVIGAGNLGVAAAKALELSPDLEICGFIRRKNQKVNGFADIPVAESFFDLPEKPDGAIIALPSRLAEEVEKQLLEAGIFTADAFDIHEELSGMRQRLSAFAKKGGVSAIIGAGWDPGLDSVIRTLMLSAAPSGITFTDFGPGMSMGHSAAAKSVEGVADALSFTLPLGYGKHLRKIYAVLKENADKTEVEHAILSDGYFEHDECSVSFSDSVSDYFTAGHRVKINRFGSSSGTGNQHIEFSMEIDNPSLTGQILVSAIRAAFLQKPGAYFLPEIPPCDFCAGEWENVL